MIWIGWKQICEKTGASPKRIRQAKKERNFPLQHPFKRPQVIAEDYIKWLKNQPDYIDPLKSVK